MFVRQENWLILVQNNYLCDVCKLHTTEYAFLLGKSRWRAYQSAKQTPFIVIVGDRGRLKNTHPQLTWECDMKVWRDDAAGGFPDMMSRVIQCKTREQNQFILTQGDGDRNIEHGHHKWEPRDVKHPMGAYSCMLLWMNRRMDVSWGTYQVLHCRCLEENGLMKGQWIKSVPRLSQNWFEQMPYSVRTRWSCLHTYRVPHPLDSYILLQSVGEVPPWPA